MFIYHLSVSMSDDTLEISPEILDLMTSAATEANNRRNASRKGRKFEIKDLIDHKHVHIVLSSDTAVIPSRALSALSRSMIALDKNKLLLGHDYRGCILNTTVISSGEHEVTAITDVELLHTITDMIFGQNTMNNRDKKLARDLSDDLRTIAINFINNRSQK
ncbi:MAG: hypothetical protein ACI4SE_04455 [Lachnospiraceae bacterium]